MELGPADGLFPEGGVARRSDYETRRAHRTVEGRRASPLRSGAGAGARPPERVACLLGSQVSAGVPRTSSGLWPGLVR